MGILSSQNLILFRTVFLLTISFFCIKDVTSILQNTYFLVLTQAMDLPALSLSPYSGQLGLISFVFLLLALHDIVPFLEGNKVYFRSIVPVRLTIYFIIGAVSFLWVDNLFVHNNAVFIYSFVEIWINFLLLNAVREERNEDFRQEHQFMNEEDIVEEPAPFVESKKD